MNREIEFRAFVNGRMGVPFDPFDPTFLSSGGTFPEGTIFMQCTGLKDKNGKEIYEGDIIRFKVDFPDQPYDNGVVRWCDGGYWTSQSEGDLEEFLSEELDDLEGEVIGNIYENPELLQS